MRVSIHPRRSRDHRERGRHEGREPKPAQHITPATDPRESPIGDFADESQDGNARPVARSATVTATRSAACDRSVTRLRAWTPGLASRSRPRTGHVNALGPSASPDSTFIQVSIHSGLGVRTPTDQHLRMVALTRGALRASMDAGTGAGSGWRSPRPHTHPRR